MSRRQEQVVSYRSVSNFSAILSNHYEEIIEVKRSLKVAVLLRQLDLFTIKANYD